MALPDFAIGPGRANRPSRASSCAIESWRIEQLVQANHAFTAAYSKNAAPFVWRKREVKGAQLRNTIVNLSN